VTTSTHRVPAQALIAALGHAAELRPGESVFAGHSTDPDGSRVSVTSS